MVVETPERIPTMLVLSRRPDEKIVFPSIQATVQVVTVKPGVVRLGIEAPDTVPVFRQEVLDRLDPAERAAFEAAGHVPEALVRDLRHTLNNRLNAATIGVALLKRQLQLGRTADMASTLDRLGSDLGGLKQRLEEAIEAVRPSEALPARKKALLVEDDLNEAELLAGFLRLAGNMEVVTAGDGADALDYLRSQGRPDFVLLDMMLPRCDGPTTVRTIRGTPDLADLTIYGLTGAATEQFGLSEGPQGINRWFRKPLNPESLLRALHTE